MLKKGTVEREHHWLRRALIVACLVLSAFILLRFRFARGWGADDAYISFRYAANLVEGHGLVFNPGERVEGYTNLLHVLICAVWIALFGRDWVLHCVVGMNLVVLSLTLWMLAHQLARMLPRAHTLLVIALFALSPLVWFSATSGLETPLVLSAQVALWVCVERALADRRRLWPVCLAMVCVGLCLLRADGFVSTGLAIVFLSFKRRFKLAAVAAFATLVTLSAHVGFRLEYYELPLPNTYYAKVTGAPLLRWYVGVKKLFFLCFKHGLLLPGIGVSLAWLSATFRRSLPPFAAFYCAGLLAFNVYIGGDVYAERFVQVVYPLGYLSLFQGLRGTSRFIPRTLAVVAFAMQIVPLWLDPRHRLALEKRDAWVTLGRFLGERHPSASLAVGAAGKIPYFSRAYTIDMLGLTEPTIARTQAHGFSPGHSKWDAVYVLSRQPDVICAGVRSNLDLGLGLKRALWMRAGYELRYAVRGDQVRDISASSESEQRALVQRGFSFACLGRIERAASTNEPVSS